MKGSRTMKYFRIRMQALKWYVFILDEHGTEMPENHKGPFDSFIDAENGAKETGLIDMDRSEFPRGRDLVHVRN